MYGELLRLPEKLVLAPAPGTFRPLRSEPGPDGARLAIAEVIGFVDGPRVSVPVQSHFQGHLMGFLAWAGERVREGQPVAWLRVAWDAE